MDITIYQPEELQTREFSNSLFVAFVDYIDRKPATVRSYLRDLKQFAAYMAYKAIRNPIREDVISFREFLIHEHDAIRYDATVPECWSYRTDRAGNRERLTCKASTCAQYLRTLKEFFSWTADSGLYPNIAKNVHPPKSTISEDYQRDDLKPDEVLRVEKNLETTAAAKHEAAAAAGKDTAGRVQRADEQAARMKAIFLLTTTAGLRVCEISRLNVGDLNTVKGQTWIMIHGKGHDEADQKKAVPAAVAEAIFDYLATRTDEFNGKSPLFCATGNRSGGKRIAPTTISSMIKSELKAAGYDSSRITAHSLRHATGGAVMEATGDNIYQAQTYLRHKSPSTTERYTHRRDDGREAQLADEVYDLFHGADKHDDLDSLIKGMNQQQRDQLAAMARIMTSR